MGRFNLDDYAPVEERIGVFYEQHPEGRICTYIERLEPPLVVFGAAIYRHADDLHPWANGFAYEKEGEGHVNQTSYIENCETSAIGRALANAGYHGRREGAPRPSREEMQKVERMGGTPAGHTPPSQPNGHKGSNVFDIDRVAPGKKAAGRTWRELLKSEDGRGFIKWAIGNMNTLDFAAKEQLQLASTAAALGDPHFSEDLHAAPLPASV